MTNETCMANKSDIKCAARDALSADHLDEIRGGDPKGYHECVLGSVGGGGPGLYPLYVQCRMK